MSCQMMRFVFNHPIQPTKNLTAKSKRHKKTEQDRYVAVLPYPAYCISIRSPCNPNNLLLDCVVTGSSSRPSTETNDSLPQFGHDASHMPNASRGPTACSPHWH